MGEGLCRNCRSFWSSKMTRSFRGSGRRPEGWRVRAGDRRLGRGSRHASQGVQIELQCADHRHQPARTDGRLARRARRKGDRSRLSDHLHHGCRRQRMGLERGVGQHPADKTFRAGPIDCGGFKGPPFRASGGMRVSGSCHSAQISRYGSSTSGSGARVTTATRSYGWQYPFGEPF